MKYKLKIHNKNRIYGVDLYRLEEIMKEIGNNMFLLHKIIDKSEGVMV